MYAKVKNNTIIKFPYGIIELLEDNPYTKYDYEIDVAEVFTHTEECMLRGCQLVQVLHSPAPEYIISSQKIIQASTPVLIDGDWIIEWIIVDLTPLEISDAIQQQADIVRKERNNKLKETDWTQMKDVPEEISSKWVTYRQTLRDIPSQSEFPWNVFWPTLPDESITPSI